MFKKKPNIPPRPRPPVTEQVLDDLKNAPEDDVVFIIMKNSTSDYLRNSSIPSNTLCDITSTQIVNEDVNNPEIVYQKVRSFLEVNSNLQTMTQKLQEQNEVLLTSNIELKKMAEDIKRQAMDALK